MSHPTPYDRILGMIDEELDRLLQARDILIACANAATHGKPKPGRKRQRRQAAVAVAEIPVPKVQVTILPPAPARKRSLRTMKSPQPEPRALTSHIPSSPVVVAPPKSVHPECQPPSRGQHSTDFGARILAAERSLDGPQS